MALRRLASCPHLLHQGCCASTTRPHVGDWTTALLGADFDGVQFGYPWLPNLLAQTRNTRLRICGSGRRERTRGHLAFGAMGSALSGTALQRRLFPLVYRT